MGPDRGVSRYAGPPHLLAGEQPRRGSVGRFARPRPAGFSLNRRDCQTSVVLE
jgi:hypothetical protein